MVLQLHNITARHEDINHGVDYERARERLAARAAHAYCAYRQVADAPLREPQAIKAAWEAFKDASLASDRLRRTDPASIGQVLAETERYSI